MWRWIWLTSSCQWCWTQRRRGRSLPYLSMRRSPSSTSNTTISTVSLSCSKQGAERSTMYYYMLSRNIEFLLCNAIVGIMQVYRLLVFCSQVSTAVLSLSLTLCPSGGYHYQECQCGSYILLLAQNSWSEPYYTCRSSAVHDVNVIQWGTVHEHMCTLQRIVCAAAVFICCIHSSPVKVTCKL